MKAASQSGWMLDTSTFINTLVIDGIRLLVRLRSPLHFPEYVFRVELGLNARQRTREQAETLVRVGTVSIQRLTVADLDRIAQIAAPRRVGLGEIACSLLAERLQFGMLCDDWKARRWLSEKIALGVWEAIEDVLLDAAGRSEISEYDLSVLQEKLAAGRYQCKFDLRLEFLQRRLNQDTP
jgi:hypothetical protein